MEKTEHNLSLKKIISNTAFLIKYIFQIKKQLYFLKLVLLILEVTGPIANIYFVRNIINAITDEAELNIVIMQVIIMALVNLAIAVMTKLMSKSFERQLQVTLQLIKCDFGSNVAKMQLSDVEQPRLRDFISLAQTSESFENSIRNNDKVIKSIINVIVYGSAIVYVQPIIVLIIAVSLTVQIILNKARLTFDDKWRTRQMPRLRKLWYFEGLLCDPRHGKELRVNLLKPWIIRKTDEQYESECLPIVKANSREVNSIGLISEILKIAETLAVYLLLAYTVVYNHVSIGDYSFYLASTFYLTSSMSGLIDDMTDMFKNGMFVSEFRYCIDLVRNMRIRRKNLSLDITAPPCIEFRNVSFKYPNTENYVLDNVSFTIKPCEKAAIVGVNGSGKTTLVKLLCRFYEPTDGAIYINSVNISDIDEDTYAKLLSVVFQDFELFSFTVMENITLTGQKNHIDESMVEQSIEQSGLRDKIASLPGKESCYVYKDFDENGVEFSGGEGQKLVIARAVYKNTPFIILDEPTAAFDPIAEYEIYKKLGDLSIGKTAIFISHRLSSTRFADRIIVLKEGSIIENGSHDELVSIADGYYRNMFETQANLYSS